MLRLPIYEAAPTTPLDSGPALALNPECSRCTLGALGPKVCISAEGVPGKDRAKGLVYVLGEAPTQLEVMHGRPMIGEIGRAVRRVVEKYWAGDYVLDTVVRCAQNSREPKYIPFAQNACSPYMRQVFRDAMPDRVIVLGHVAARGVLGRYVPVVDARKNHSWVRRPDGKLIPVMVLMAPGQTMGNRHLTRWLEEDFAWALGPLDDIEQPLPDDAVFHVVENVDDAREAVARLREYDWMAYDCETAGRHFSDFFEITSTSCTAAEDDLTFVWGRKALADERCVRTLAELLEDEVVGKVGANVKYDDLSWRAWRGVRVRGHVLDVQLTKHLDLPGSDASLKYLSECVGLGGYKQRFDERLEQVKESLRRARKKSAGGRQLFLLDEDPIFLAAVAHLDEDLEAFAYGLIKSPHLERYNAVDTIASARIARSRYGFPLVTKHPAHRNIWRNLVRRTTNTVEQIEAWGIPVNLDGIANFNKYIDGQLATVLKRLERYKVNPASPPQVAVLLFDKLRLKNPQNPGSRSTDAKALHAMASQHEVVSDLREFRRLFKLKTGYGNLHSFVRSDGRIHPTLKIDKTGTGRLSCVDPPLHQIPRKEDAEGHTEGKLIKDCFAARPGYRLVSLDESQIELRVAAALSGDALMKELFGSGQDFHLQAARIIAPVAWNIMEDHVGDAQRSATKSFVFGLLYGMTDRGLAARINCSVEQASRIRYAILGKFTGLAQWMQNCLNFSRRTGCVITPWQWEDGRIRQIPDIGINPNDEDRRGKKITAENGAINTPCQTLASDIVLKATCDVVDWIVGTPRMDARVVLTIHDAILSEVHEDQCEEYVEIVRPMMRSYDLRGVPLSVDEERGDAWGSLRKVKAVARAA